jgi:pili/flagellar assembly PapD-like chaperone
MNKLLGLFVSRFHFMKVSCKRFVLFLIAVLAFLSSIVVVEETVAQGGLQILPTRIVFEGRTRSAQVNVINQGTESQTYRISFKNMRMKEDGSYEDVEDARPDEKFASDFIRYSPRQIVIPPGESQVVRLVLRKKRDLPPGEYRSHMLFRELPPENVGESLEALSGKKGDIKIMLIPIMGITIPVIVRHGEGKATAQIGDLKLDDSEEPNAPLVLSLHLNRQGNRSLYGDLTASFKPENGGEELEVARLNGLAVFTPNKNRVVKMKLAAPEGVELKRGLLSIVYRENPDEGDKILAEGQLQIP